MNVGNKPLSSAFITLWLIALTAVAAYIRIKGGSDYYYSEDELLHIGIAQATSLKELLQFSLYETHPPLGHILRHYWLMVSEDIAFSRSLSLICGLALIPLYYRIGKLLDSPFTGMCIAALAAFGYGCIIQSYVARNYTIFLFFITLSLYCYLQWHTSKKDSLLIGYTLVSILACLTHFSGIMAIFSIAAYETLTTLKTRPLKWIAANIIIAAIAITAYCIWQQHGIVLSYPYFSAPSWLHYIFIVILNPIAVSAYILPSIYVIPLIIFLLFLPTVRADSRLRQFLLLTCVAFSISAFLVALNRYYPGGTRQALWCMPFIITTAGWIISNVINSKSSISHQHIALLLLLTGCAISFENQRFQAEEGEYQMKVKDWSAMTAYVDSLDKKSLIVAARDDAVLLTNTYPHLGNDGFNKQAIPKLIPYENTYILTNSFERRITSKSALLHQLKYAQEKGMLEGVENIIFMKTVWDVYAKDPDILSRLFACNQLEKRTVSFPAFTYPDTDSTTEEERKIAPVGFMQVAKTELFSQLISPGGKAYDCLK